MKQVMEAHKEASHILFCGDGLRDIEDLKTFFPRKIFVEVRGNCDLLYLASDIPSERLLTIFNLRILLLHGHEHGVKGSYGVAAAHAQRCGADILIFGHTHLAYEGRLAVGDKEVHLFNPGSIGTPKNGTYSYGVLTIRENGYLFSHGSIR